MHNYIYFSLLFACSAAAGVKAPAPAPVAPESASTQDMPAANQTNVTKTTSIQDMLATGPVPLKLHSLAMISQGQIKGSVDESYLPGFQVCAEDPNVPLRSITALLLGQHFIQGKDNPNPEAVAILKKLANDGSADVRYKAVYHGLTQMRDKPEDIITLLLEIATTHREQTLYNQIIDSLKDNRDQVTEILNSRLSEGGDIAVYEIYEDLTGRKPDHAEKYLDMPSSRPVMFVFMAQGDDNHKFRTDLETELKALGLTNAAIYDGGAGDDYAVMLKTHITRDRVVVEDAFANHAQFPSPQIWWLTPELEISFEEWRNK